MFCSQDNKHSNTILKMRSFVFLLTFSKVAFKTLKLSLTFNMTINATQNPCWQVNLKCLVIPFRN